MEDSSKIVLDSIGDEVMSSDFMATLSAKADRVAKIREALAEAKSALDASMFDTDEF